MPEDIVISDKVVINAPAAKVWEVLIDLDNYPKWNPFTVKVESDLQMGQKVDLHLNKKGKPGETFVQREYLQTYEPEKQLAWGMKWFHPWILDARRDQYIEAIDEHRCSYYTTDKFEGLCTGMVMKSHGDWIKQGFDSVAHALKKHVESLTTEQTAEEPARTAETADSVSAQ